MLEIPNDNFNVGNTIYVIDYFCSHSGTKAIIANAKIEEIFEDTKIISVSLNNSYIRRYHFKDYNRLFFDNYGKAEITLYNLPEPKSVVYTISKEYTDKIQKKNVVGIYDTIKDNITDLIIIFKDGEKVSTSDIGKNIFLKEIDAYEYLSNSSNY